MSNFDIAVAFTLREEGGDKITEDTADLGGLTKYGIAQRWHPNVDIRNLTEDGAKAIYKTEYWDKLHCSDLPPGLSIAAFDCAVNPGTGSASRFLQMAVGVPVDGVVGDHTVVAAKATSQSVAINAICNERIELYKRNPEYPRFGAGWIARVERCRVLAMQNITPAAEEASNGNG